MVDLAKRTEEFDRRIAKFNKILDNIIVKVGMIQSDVTDILLDLLNEDALLNPPNEGKE